MWFRVDDSFVGHPKAAGLSNDSAATWLRAGDWSAWQLTDGLVPAELLAQFAGDATDPEAVARDLVDRRLWEDAEDGWQFHDWADYNPTKAQVLAKRKKDAERRRDWLARANAARNAVSHAVSHGVSSSVSSSVSHGVTDDQDHAVSHGVSHGVSHAAPDPTRPVGSVRVDVDNQSSGRYARAPARGPAEIIRSVFPDATDDEIEIISQTRTSNGARSVEAVLTHEVGQGTLRLPCDPGGPGRHSAACRDGNPDGCGVDWCACRHHLEPVIPW